MESNILVIYTGGTIGMIQDPATEALTPFNFDALYKHIPIFRISTAGLTPTVLIRL